MPVEIKELVIRANVVPEGEPGPGSVGQGGGGADKAGMVAEVVEQVLDILRRERER
jgi:hypothetical protein